MSIIEPKIDVLLDQTDNDRFLLCALASKRAHDINDMMRGQRDRAIQLQTAVEIARAGRIIVVHVSGAVASSGVYELPEGSRVSDAIDAAGGMVDDASEDALNLARGLVDGEQVVVPTVEEHMQELQAAADGGASPSGKVNINTATAEQLDTLPGIGESTAQKIIADREANGPFASPEDLKRVSGIGDKKYAELADLITVG